MVRNLEIVGASPGPGGGFLFLALSLSDYRGIILDHKLNCSGRDKERGKIKPSSAICELNTDKRAMYAKKVKLRIITCTSHCSEDEDSEAD